MDHGPEVLLQGERMKKTKTLDKCVEDLEEYVAFTKPILPADWGHREHDIRNETLEEIASAISAMPFGDTSASFAAWIRQQKSGPGRSS